MVCSPLSIILGCVDFAAMRADRHHHYQHQQLGKPAESRAMTSPQHDKENIVTSSSSSGQRSIFGCVELLAETSCSRPPHPTTLQPPYLVTRVDQSPSSHYRHVTSSPVAMFAAAVTSSPVACPSPVCAIYRLATMQRFHSKIPTNIIITGYSDA